MSVSQCFGTTKKEETRVAPTWYSGNPTINQALVLAIKNRLDAKSESFPNYLRFARSGEAHLSHSTALQLSKILDIPILPAYGMSECRPVCLSSVNPIRWNTDGDDLIPDTVGIPIGPSVKVIGENGLTLPIGSNQVGEVVVGGPGVISKYWGLDKEESHTPDG